MYESFNTLKDHLKSYLKKKHLTKDVRFSDYRKTQRKETKTHHQFYDILIVQFKPVIVCYEKLAEKNAIVLKWKKHTIFEEHEILLHARDNLTGGCLFSCSSVVSLYPLLAALKLC